MLLIVFIRSVPRFKSDYFSKCKSSICRSWLIPVLISQPADFLLFSGKLSGSSDVQEHLCKLFTKKSSNLVKYLDNYCFLFVIVNCLKQFYSHSYYLWSWHRICLSRLSINLLAPEFYI